MLSFVQLLHLSEQALPGQLDFLGELALLPPALAATNGNTISKLDLIFGGLPGTGTVVGEVHAGEGAGTEVVRTLSYDASAADHDNGEQWLDLHTVLVLCLVPTTVAPHIRLLLLLLLLSAAAKHLIEETKLRSCGEGPETKQEE